MWFNITLNCMYISRDRERKERENTCTCTCTCKYTCTMY